MYTTSTYLGMHDQVRSELLMRVVSGAEPFPVVQCYVAPKLQMTLVFGKSVIGHRAVFCASGRCSR